jgi:hypothetical protein
VQPACWRIQAEKLAPFLMEIDIWNRRGAAGAGTQREAAAAAAARGGGSGGARQRQRRLLVSLSEGAKISRGAGHGETCRIPLAAHFVVEEGGLR